MLTRVIPRSRNSRSRACGNTCRVIPCSTASCHAMYDRTPGKPTTPAGGTEGEGSKATASVRSHSDTSTGRLMLSRRSDSEQSLGMPSPGRIFLYDGTRATRAVQSKAKLSSPPSRKCRTTWNRSTGLEPDGFHATLFLQRHMHAFVDVHTSSNVPGSISIEISAPVAIP